MNCYECGYDLMPLVRRTKDSLTLRNHRHFHVCCPACMKVSRMSIAYDFEGVDGGGWVTGVTLVFNLTT